MADNDNTKFTGTVQDVTAMLTQRALDRVPNEGSDKPVSGGANGSGTDLLADQDDLDQDEDQDEQGEDQDQDQDPDDQDPDQDPDEEDQDQEDDEDDLDGAEGDDQLIEVKVDGEVKKVSLRELKTAYSAEGAVQKRLKEATEHRKAASNTRTQAMQDAEEVRQSLIRVVQQLDQTLHAPHVQSPDAALKTSNPTRYLAQLEAYNADQQRIQQARQLWLQLFQQQAEVSKKVKEANKKEQIELLQTAVPALRDKAKAKRASGRIVKAANRYGFTDDELRQVNDHRLYVMAHDAERYHEIIASGKLDLTQLGQENQSKERRRTSNMKSGNTKGRTRATIKEKQISKVREAAKASGKTQDVAAYLAARHAQERKPSNGR